MPSKTVTIKPHPELDWAIAKWGGVQIPTKQDKFKPLIGFQGIIQEGDEEIILNDLYVKNPDAKSIDSFISELRELIKENMTSNLPYKHPNKIEVILSFDIQKKRFFEVDIDNLSKCILDAMNGLVFDDDSQVVNLLAMKHTHPWNTNGLSIGIKLVEDSNRSWFNGIKLFYMEENKEDSTPTTEENKS